MAIAVGVPLGRGAAARAAEPEPAPRASSQAEAEPQGESGSGTAYERHPPDTDEGLIPFLPQWLPLGPVLTPEKATPRPPPMRNPETMVQSPPAGSTPDPNLPHEELHPEGSVWTFVPVPILYADPNLGFGIGLMPVFLIHPEDRIEWIVAPSFDWNELLGLSVTNRVYYYPTIREELFVYNDWSTEGKTEHEARFHGRDRFLVGSDFHARGYVVRDPTRRFFGLGAATEEEDETDYEMRESAVEADMGYRLLDEVRVAATLRYRHSTVGNGILDDQDDTVDAFPDLGGVRDDLTTVLAYGGRVTLDLRDDPTFPARGILVDVFAEVSSRGFVSSTRFARWGASVTGYFAIGLFDVEDALVSVGRVAYHEVRGDSRLPFWEQPTLGGRSQLRGFGVGRFTDEGYLFASVEERLRVYELTIRQNRLRIEVAAFLDVGRVFGEGGGWSERDWQYVPGLGARILIPDSGIIARGDVGFGGEGPAIFLTLGYPF